MADTSMEGGSRPSRLRVQRTIRPLLMNLKHASGAMRGPAEGAHELEAPRERLRIVRQPLRILSRPGLLGGVTSGAPGSARLPKRVAILPEGEQPAGNGGDASRRVVVRRTPKSPAMQAGSAAAEALSTSKARSGAMPPRSGSPTSLACVPSRRGGDSRLRA